MLGSSGIAEERFAVLTASARSLPAFTCGMYGGMLSMVTAIWPPITSASTPALPLYGMCTMLAPVMLLNSSIDRCAVLPLPGEP